MRRLPKVRTSARTTASPVAEATVGAGGGGPFSPTSLSALRQFALDGSTPYYSPTKVNNLEVLNPLESYGTLRAPRQGRCWLFDGSDDYGVVSGHPLSGYTGDFTLCAWVKLSASGSTPMMFSADPVRLEFRFNGAARVLQVISTTGISASINSPNATPLNTWTHVAATFTAATKTFTIYENGLSVASVVGTGANIDFGNSLHIGARAGLSPFPGLMHSIRIIKRAVTNFTDIMAGGEDASDFAHYPCNEESGLIGYDIGPNAYHLTLTNITQSTFHATDTSLTTNRNNEFGYGLANNLFTNSEDITSSGGWVSITHGTAITSVANNALDPNGGMTADTITFPIPISTSGQYAIWRKSYSTSVVGTYTFSVWLSSPTSHSVYLRINDNTGNKGKVLCNLTPTPQRFSVTGTTSTSVTIISGDIGADGNTSETMVAGSVVAWGAQLELSTEATRYTKTGSATISGVYIPKRLSSDLAADGGALTATGRSPLPIVVETPCITGDGSAVYADLGSALIPASADFDISIRYYQVSAAAIHTIISQGVSGSFMLLQTNFNGGGVQVNQCVWLTPAGYTSATPIIAGWNKFRLTRVGSLFSLYVNDILITTKSSVTAISADTSTQILRRASGIQLSSGRIADLRITTGGHTTYFPLQDGPGSSNTNRNIAWYKSDGTYGVINNAIVNGTIANIWANRCPGYVQDHCVNYGGRLGAGGEFILGVPDTSLCADGNAITLPAGRHGNPFSRRNHNPFLAAELNGRSIPTALAPGGSIAGVTPSDSMFYRANDDRLVLLSEAATGSDLTNLQDYVA